MIEIIKPDKTMARVLGPGKLLAGTVYVPSQFTLDVFCNGKHYVQNTLTKQCIEAQLPEQCRAGEGYDDLIRSMFLVPEDKDECAFYTGISSLLKICRHKEGTKSFTILPTLACNAHCVYCYEEGMKPVTMTSETVAQTIRYILEHRQDDKVSLHWFGGEPLLYPAVIDRICEGLREANVRYGSAIVSNGSLITPGIIRKMAGEWNISMVQISMDGSESDYIARKRYFSYQDEYHKVMKMISAMSEAGIKVSVRCNVDEENLDTIPGFLEDLKNTVNHKDNVWVYFATLYGTRSGENNLSLWKKVMALNTMVRPAGFNSGSGFKKKEQLRLNHCMADGSGVVIAPDGSLYPCEHCPPESRFGDIWHGVTDAAAKEEFCRTDRIREKCRRCPFLPVCTGFASCPVQNNHCRELKELSYIESLRRKILSAGESQGTEEFYIGC